MKIIDELALSKLLKKRKMEEYTEDILEELSIALSKTLEDSIRIIKNKKRIIANDNNKEHTAIRKVFSEERIMTFPSWVRENIDTAQIVGKSHNVIQTSNGKKYHVKNPLNDLSGAEWTFFLNSVINTRYSTSGEDGFAHHIRKIHPSPKPPQLMENIIRFFTKENEYIFDYFMGVGGSLLGASLANRRAIGIDLDRKYIQAYKNATNELNLKEQTTIVGDSIKILKNPKKINNILENENVSLILIDPPYGDMMARKKTGEAIKNGKDASATPFTSLPNDLGNMNWSTFRTKFKKSVVNATKLLKNKGHIVVFIKDLQPKGNDLNLLHADLIHDLSSIDNILYLGTKIWADQGVNLYPYGYPYSFVSNQIHQYILIFKKVENEKS